MDESFVPFSSPVKKLEDDGSGPALLTSLSPPWLEAELVDYELPPLVRLHNEVLSFCEYIAPTPSELSRRENILSEVREIVKSLWPEATVHVFGSQMTQILTPTSDIDIAVLNVPEPGPGATLANLFDLSDKLRSADLVSYIEVISSAKVPIIKFDHKVSGIPVDICLNNSTGLETGKVIRTYVRQYPPLRPLCMVLKVFLAQRRLNETYSGGVGSFVLSCMIVSFLQMKQRVESFRGIKQTCTWGLGVLLTEFFALYGGTFNLMHTGITMTDGGAYFRKRERSPDWGSQTRPGLLSVENPTDEGIDMGRNSFMMPRVRRALEHAHQLLVCSLSDWRHSSYLAFLVRPDDSSLSGRSLPSVLAAADVSRFNSSCISIQASEVAEAADDSELQSAKPGKRRLDEVRVNKGGRKRL